MNEFSKKYDYEIKVVCSWHCDNEEKLYNIETQIRLYALLNGLSSEYTFPNFFKDMFYISDLENFINAVDNIISGTQSVKFSIDKTELDKK